MPKARDGVVVEVDMRDLDISRQRITIDRKTVIVRGDLDLAGVEIFDRLIAAAMAEFEFVCLAAKNLAENLMPEADAEHRHVRLGQFFDLADHCSSSTPGRPAHSKERCHPV